MTLATVRLNDVIVRNRASGAALAPVSAPTSDALYDRPVPDPYRWLESPDSPATLRWLARRRREFDRAAASWPLRDRLAARIRDLVAADLWSPPVHRSGRAFTTVRTAGDEHPRIVVFDSPRAAPRTVYDPAAEDPGGGTTLDAWEPSPDGELVAVQTSRGGVERGELRVFEVRSGRAAGEPIRGVRYSHVAWLPGGDPAFYYVRRDSGDGRRGVWLHRIGGGGDTLVHECTAPRTVPGVSVSGGRWLVVTESHGTGHRTDVWVADLESGAAAAPRLRPLHVGADIETEVRAGSDGLLYLRTTLGADRRRICAVSPREPGVEHWREIVPEDPGATLDAFAVGPGTGPGPCEVFVARTRLGISELAVHSSRDGRRLRRVDLPGEGMVTRLGAEPDGTLYLCYADVATQQTVLRLGPGEGRPAPWPGGTRSPADSPRVHRRTTWCRSADGTPVPVTVFSAGAGPAPAAPTILHAYGGFGRARQFGFSATVLAWLLCGGQYAVAHVRGGGDGGRTWHLAGARRNKPRAVEDLIAAADALVASGRCAREELCLSGGSAGGLLVLAAAARRPDLCAAVIASAPLADMARFERLGLGAMWTREFGTAADPDDFAALLSYSPYHRVLAGAALEPGRRRARVLLTGFHGDTRTDAAHPRKMCAALLAAAPPEHAEEAGPPALLRYEHEVGHGPRAVSRAIDLAADAHAFAAAQTGLLPR